MPNHDIVVIGASAGGVEALQTLARSLPESLDAAVFVVLHIPAEAPSVLARILDRRSNLPALQAIDGLAIEPGRIYVAPPDHHLILDPGYVRVARGPKENRHRPAIDPLFRSAALHYGPRVIGVILSGTMDDGVAGLKTIKACGGLAIVQDPRDALYPGMPLQALEKVNVDQIAPVAKLGQLLADLVRQPASEGEIKVPDGTQLEVNMAKNEVPASDAVFRLGEPSVFTCPECHGTLFEMGNKDMLRFRCRVGHAYSSESLDLDNTEALESALWIAMRTLEESSTLSRRMAERAQQDGQTLAASTFIERAVEREAQAEVIRSVLLGGKTLGTNQADVSA